MTQIGDPREVGWYSWAEWNYTRELLYSLNEPKRMIKGVNMVNCWKSRLKAGGLPISVDLTAALVSAYLLCLDGDVYQARMSAATAVVRFVNGITDQHQTGIYAQSVQIIADKLDIPDWLVDMRHEATHSELPGFDTLKAGLNFALNWLDTHYWQETYSTIIEKGDALLANLNQLIGDYLDVVFSILECNTTSKDKGKKLVRQKEVRCYEISKLLCRCVHVGNLRKFVSILTQKGFFVLNEKQIQLLGISVNGCNETLNEISIEKLSVFSNYWKPLLSSLQNSFPSFVELLTRKIVSKRNWSSEVYFSYLLSIYVIYQFDQSTGEQLVVHLLKNPSPFGFQLLRMIIETRYCTEICTKIVRFMDIFTPVIGCLNTTSVTFEMQMLDFMGLEAAEKAKEMLNARKKNSTQLNIKPSTLYPRLMTSEELSLLPPMGEFESDEKIFCLDLDKSFKGISSGENDTSKTLDILKHHNDLYEGDCLKTIIDNLFLHDTVFVSDYYSENSSTGVTEEYQCENEAWAEEIDLNVDVKNPAGINCAPDVFDYRPKEWSVFDSSKMVLF